MFARSVYLHLKPNCVAEFTQTIDDKVIPILRKQKGFQDEIAFIVPNGTEAVSITLWDRREDAESYSRGGYPEALRALAKVVEGNPQVQTHEVSNSTFHKIVSHVAA
jgi:heme-degrading monooxygenase HmoA